MSVRNILDGTIKVGGDGSMPVEPVIPEKLVIGDSELGSTTIDRGLITNSNIITNNITAIGIQTSDCVNTSELVATTRIASRAITVGDLNLFANDQVITEVAQIDFADGSRAITSVQAKVSATWLAITQNLHLFQLTITKLTGMPATLKELTLTVPQIKPSYTFTLYDAVSVLVNDTPVLANLTIEAIKNASLVVTITFPSALENPTALSVRFLREMS